ncbi:hypothetical protein ABYF34_00890 [Buchananella felis]|uniref:hypothetical protein n=1 Tax=Buchananella felis TaxID=3231492 RepID=UPI003527628C
MHWRKWSVKAKIISIVASLVVLGLAVFGATQLFPYFNRQSADERVVQSLTLEDDVVLLRLGVQGIATEKVDASFLGMSIPGSAKNHFLQYDYSAMLGIDGGDVKVEKTGDKRFKLSIPAFEFLGHSDAEFKTIVEDNGVISFITPDVDLPALITRVLNDTEKEKHITDSMELLEYQCRNFYESIVRGIDPEIQLEFVFASAAPEAEQKG